MALTDIMTENHYGWLHFDGVCEMEGLKLHIIHHIERDIYFTSSVLIHMKWFAWVDFCWSTNILHVVPTWSSLEKCHAVQVWSLTEVLSLFYGI